MDGFSGIIPQEQLHYQVCPLINSFWWKILLDRGIKDCDLPGLMSEITKLGAEFNPIHQRRLNVFNVRRQGEAHSEFLHRLEQSVDAMDYETMTRNQFVIHLFLSQADSVMGKQAAEFLQAPSSSQNMADFRTDQADRDFSLVWYKEPGKVCGWWCWCWCWQWCWCW